MEYQLEHTAKLSIAGETLRLLPERAIAWPAHRTLLVADTHFGKAATFRSHGIPVPEATTFATLNRLTTALAQTEACRLIVLGDLVHSSIKAAHSFEQSLCRWRSEHPDLEIVLLLGNHDRGRGDLFADLNIRVVSKSLSEGPFEFAHAAESLADSSQYGLTGHVHPQIELPEGKKKLRLPCFWFGTSHAVLPAFGDFTGCATVKPAENEKAFVIAQGRVIEIRQN